jgi:mycothiol synthase
MPSPGGYQVALGADDLPALAGLVRRCLDADGGLPDAASEPFIRRHYLSGPGRGWHAADGTLIAAGALGDLRDGRRLAAGMVDPARRGRGTGRSVLDWTVATAAGEPLLIGSESVSESARRLYARYGLREVFAEQVMRADLADRALPARPGAPAPDLPDNLRLTAWNSKSAPAFFAAYSAAFRDRPGFPGWSQADWVARTADDEDFAPGRSLLAAVSGEPAGFVTVAADWIVQLGVVPGWRGRGLGRVLLAAAMSGARAAGFSRCWLTVATNNPDAARLYERSGFAVAGCRARYELG